MSKFIINGGGPVIGQRIGDHQNIEMSFSSESTEVTSVQQNTVPNKKVRAMLVEALKTKNVHQKQWWLWRIMDELGFSWSESDEKPEEGVAPSFQ